MPLQGPRISGFNEFIWTHGFMETFQISLLSFTVKRVQGSELQTSLKFRNFGPINWNPLRRPCPWYLIPNIVDFQIVGLIVPPLPPQSGSDPHSAESKTKKQFGSSARAMIGDDFKVEAKCLERFLQQMLCHPIFGRDKHLEEFLMQKHPPIRYV